MRSLLVCAMALMMASCALSQVAPSTGFLGQLEAGAGGAAGQAAGARAATCNGTTPANVVIESITPVPAAGQLPRIVLRNIGGQTANLTGWRLFAGGAANGSADNSQKLYIGDNVRCRPNATLPSGQSLTFYPASDKSPCGFPFTLAGSGTVTLADFNDAPKSVMSWDNAEAGTQIHVPISGNTAIRVPAGGNVIDVLKSLGSYGTFLLALQTTGLDAALAAASDPNYTAPRLPSSQIVLDLPWWFQGAQGGAATVLGSAQNDTSNTPPPVGVPAAGPYTILAPTDDAFTALLVKLGQGSASGAPLPLDALLAQPQLLKDILLYHIIPGRYTSTYLRNNTAVYTAKGVEVIPIVDGCQTEGKIALSDSCVDKPTGDNFTCAEQKAFGKCDFPFMVSPLAAQWQGGFCQRTCGRCDCSASSSAPCSIVQQTDVDANNGVIHGISRVLFPPPIFTKEQAIADARAYNESAARNASMGLPVTAAPGGVPEAGPAQAPGLPVAPGATTPPVAPGATTPAPATTPPGANASEPAAATTPPTTPPPASASPDPAAAAAAAAAAASPAPSPPASGRKLRAW